MKYLKPGQDFFCAANRDEHKAFGFHGSIAGDARNHPMDPAGEEDGATYVERRAKGGPITKPSTAHPNDPKGYQLGGMVDGAPSGRPPGAPMPQGQPTGGALSHAMVTMPVGDAAQAMGSVARAGKAAGARQAVNAIANAARIRHGGTGSPMMPAAQQAVAASPQPAPAQQGVPTMAKGGRTPDFHPGGSPGKLHREMHIPEGEKIPAGRLQQATRSRDPEVRRDAIRAETMKHWGHGRSGH